MRPIDMMWERVQWTAVPGADGTAVSDMPHATHTGVLEIGPCRIDCARLSNGKAVITEDGLLQFMEWMGLETSEKP